MAWLAPDGTIWVNNVVGNAIQGFTPNGESTWRPGHPRSLPDTLLKPHSRHPERQRRVPACSEAKRNESAFGRRPMPGGVQRVAATLPAMPDATPVT